MKTKIKETFLKHIYGIKGQKCFKIGFSIGTILILNFGREVIYLPPIITRHNNKFLTTGDNSFTVVCFWRVEHNNRVLFTNHYYEDDNSISILEEKVKILQNKTVLDVNINQETFDFSIDFEDSYRLTVINSVNQFTRKRVELYTFCTFNELFSMKQEIQLNMRN
jgi:hypothetical protein